MKRILITGDSGYIGTAVKAWLERTPAYYRADTLSVRKENWRSLNFEGFDCIFHAAGMAHADVEQIGEKKRKEYYDINTKLTETLARKAKEAGVRQFIFMSSMLVYGNGGRVGERKYIDKSSKPLPDSVYGDSKWQAENKLLQMDSADFRVVILRTPMVYGKNSKGNYRYLSEIAKRVLLFPEIQNERSMIYIDNLCEFVKLIIDSEEKGIFYPQNLEYTKTSEMVKMIAEASGKKVFTLRLLAPFVRLMSRFPGRAGRLINKAFGNYTYSKELSSYEWGIYQIKSLQQSIEEIEKDGI